MPVYTISTHTGSGISWAHNRRERRITDREPHINPEGTCEVIRDCDIREAYDEIFGDAVRRYNDRQTRPERRIRSYYNNVCSDEKRHPAYEMIVTVGNRDAMPSEQEAHDALLEFADGWRSRNPNMIMVGCYYHADEWDPETHQPSAPHLHIDYIPVARGYKRGMDTQCSYARGLAEQGFSGRMGGANWWASENQVLEDICKARGWEIIHPERDTPDDAKRRHERTANYKQMQDVAKDQAQQTIQDANDYAAAVRSDADDIAQQTQAAQLTLQAVQEAAQALQEDMDNQVAGEIKNRLAMTPAREIRAVPARLQRGKMVIDADDLQYLLDRDKAVQVYEDAMTTQIADAKSKSDAANKLFDRALDEYTEQADLIKDHARLQRDYDDVSRKLADSEQLASRLQAENDDLRSASDKKAAEAVETATAPLQAKINDMQRGYDSASRNATSLQDKLNTLQARVDEYDKADIKTLQWHSDLLHRTQDMLDISPYIRDFLGMGALLLDAEKLRDPMYRQKHGNRCTSVHGSAEWKGGELHIYYQGKMYGERGFANTYMQYAADHQLTAHIPADLHNILQHYASLDVRKRTGPSL